MSKNIYDSNSINAVSCLLTLEERRNGVLPIEKRMLIDAFYELFVFVEYKDGQEE